MENDYNSALSLLTRRLKTFYKDPPLYSDKKVAWSKKSVESAVEGIQSHSFRLAAMGGYSQQDRMIYDKKRSLDRALVFSYQGADIKRIDAPKEESSCRALINPNKLKKDYDDKVVSVHWEYGLKPGSIFKWIGTDTNWIVYLQDLTELAYFRGDIRKCTCEIKWFDKESGEIYSTPAAVRGPVETKIRGFSKEDMSIEKPNYSLNILIPKTDEAVDYFKRYSLFYLQDNTANASIVCWRVEAVDWISMPGVLEIVAQEYYSNKDIDEVGEIPGYKEIMKKKELEDAIKEKESESIITIKGETFIKPFINYKYSCPSLGKWDFYSKSKGSLPLEVKRLDDFSIELKWTKSFSGQFEMVCDKAKKVVIVESLY